MPTSQTPATETPVASVPTMHVVVGAPLQYKGIKGNASKFSKLIGSSITVDGIPVERREKANGDFAPATLALSRKQTDAIDAILAAARLRDQSDASLAARAQLRTGVFDLPLGGKQSENLAADLAELIAMDESDS